jgi:hypothetical protein
LLLVTLGHAEVWDYPWSQYLDALALAKQQRK